MLPSLKGVVPRAPNGCACHRIKVQCADVMSVCQVSWLQVFAQAMRLDSTDLSLHDYWDDGQCS